MPNILRTLTLLAGVFLCSGAPAADKIDIPSEVTLFKNVMVFNGNENKLHDVDVLVVKNKIHKIARNIPTMGTWEIDVTTGGVQEVQGSIGGTDTYTFTIFSEGKSEKKQTKVNIIDGGGRTLMPGLIDAHVHLNMQLVGHDLFDIHRFPVAAPE